MSFNQNVWDQARKLIFEASKGAPPEVMQQLDELVLHTDGAFEDCIETPECGIIALGNWNCTYAQTDDGSVQPDNNTMPMLGNALEKLGIELDWSDCYEICACCGKLVRTEPTHYGWLPRHCFIEGLGDVCAACIIEDHAEEYFQMLEGHGERAVALEDVDPTDHDYVQIIGECENGLYHGQDDDPESIATALRKLGIERFLFKVDSTGQFDTHFSVFVHEDEAELFDVQRYAKALKQPELSPAEACQQYLQNASAAMKDQGDKPGVTIIRRDPEDDTQPVIKTITPLEFVQGKAFQEN